MKEKRRRYKIKFLFRGNKIIEELIDIIKIEKKAYIQKTSPIILIGGVGRILWLLSTESNSKQFNPIIKELSIYNLEKT